MKWKPDWRKIVMIIKIIGEIINKLFNSKK
jgi:hypothetical protein